MAESRRAIDAHAFLEAEAEESETELRSLYACRSGARMLKLGVVDADKNGVEAMVVPMLRVGLEKGEVGEGVDRGTKKVGPKDADGVVG